MGLEIFDMVKWFLNDTKEVLSRKEKLRVAELVNQAVRYTSTHIARTREERTDVPSQILSTYWQHVADRLRHISPARRVQDFAAQLQEKSKYWSDPKGYNPARLDLYAISLTEVESILQDLTA